MHEQVYKEWADEEQKKKEEEEKKEKEKAATQTETEEKKKPEATKKPAKKKSSKDPPINLLITMLGNVKLEIDKIHVRFEDDFFAQQQPYSMGLTIENISMETVDTYLHFEKPTSANFSR